ncbi:MAG: IS1634 family transposase, partial [Flavobacteriaceae bacterium]|nr:IS1634 family transposase [Flavobacteriaceae bacterium]
MIHFNHNRSESTATTSIGTLLNLGKVDVHEVLDMLDWLNKRKPFIERTLAKRHLVEGTMILYDVSSSYFEGSKCILSAFGYSRDKRRDKRQVVFGLLCTQEGCPIAIEVFTGNTADPRTLGTQIAKIKKRFGLSRVIL